MTVDVLAYDRHAKTCGKARVRYLCRSCMRGGSRGAMVWHLQFNHALEKDAAEATVKQALADLQKERKA